MRLGLLLTIPNPTFMKTYIKLINKQIYNFGIVYYNPWCTYSPLVPKRDTFLSRVRTVMTLFFILVFYIPSAFWKCISFHNSSLLNWLPTILCISGTNGPPFTLLLARIHLATKKEEKKEEILSHHNVVNNDSSFVKANRAINPSPLGLISMFVVSYTYLMVLES